MLGRRYQVPPARIEVRDVAGHAARATAHLKQGMRAVGRLGLQAVATVLLAGGTSALFWVAIGGTRPHTRIPLDELRRVHDPQTDQRVFDVGGRRRRL